MKRVTLHKLIDRPSSNHNMAATGQPTPSGGKRTLHLLLVLGIGLLTSNSWLQAQTTIYVDANTSVNSNNDGTQAKPYKTATAAITAAGSGDSIILKSGTYSEALTIDKKLTIQGQDSTETGSVITNKITITTTEPVILSQLRISTSADDKGIEYSKETGGTISLKKVALYGKYGLSINKENAKEKYTVNIEDSHISASTHYAVWVRGQGKNEITVNRSKLEGWCAVYASLGQPDITITGSQLYGTNSFGGNFTMNWESNASSDAFATLILECTNNGTIQLENSYVAALHTASATQGQAVISFQMKIPGSVFQDFTNNTVTLKGTSSLYMDRGDVSNPVFAYSETKATVGGKEYKGENNKIVLADDWKGSITFGADNEKSSSVLYDGKTNEYRNFFVPAAIKDLSKFTVATDSVYMEIGTSNDFKAAVTALNAGPRKCSIQLAKAEYDFSNTLFTVNKNLTLSGIDTTKTILKGAIQGSAAEEETTSITLEGLTFDYKPAKVASTDSCKPMIGIEGMTNLTVKNCQFNNQTAGYGEYGEYSQSTAYNKIRPSRSYQNVIYTAPDATGQLTIENSAINLNANSQTGIFIDSKMEGVSLTDVKINGTDKCAYQFGVFVYHKNTPITLTATTIQHISHYAVYVRDAGDQTITVNNCDITGYAAIYLWGTDNATVNIINNSKLIGKSKGDVYYFGTITIRESAGNNVNITDSYVGNLYPENFNNIGKQALIEFNNKYPTTRNNIVTLRGTSTFQTTEPKAPFLFYYISKDPYQTGNKIITEGDNVRFKTPNNKDCIVTRTLDGEFRNAATNLLATLDDHYLWGNADYHEGKVFPGNEIFFTDSLVPEALKSLNAAKATFLLRGLDADDNYIGKYAIPDSVVINCKGAYLVTGESAVKALADSLSAIKTVFWLKQDTTIDANGDEPMFTTVAINSRPVKVSSNQTWDNSVYNNRSVEISNGATLTINVAMPLDTVKMHEGTQLKVLDNIEVNANVLQLVDYDVQNQWKAFGFPVKGLTVKDAKGDEVTTAATDAATGLWTAKPKAAQVGFTVTDKSQPVDTACIIAAAPAAKYTMTSKSDKGVILKTNKMPDAPTATNSPAFKICANPNTCTIQLNQEAYILSDNGKTFDLAYNPEIKPFQSYILADQKTTLTLRSMRLEDTPTSNEQIVPAQGYYVEAGKGFITIHTAEPVQVTVVDMLGRVYYNALVAYDSFRISLPAGIYAVNKQKVIVK